MIPTFYYINLDRSTQRNDDTINFFNELSKYLDETINYNRIEGFDGNSEDINSYLLGLKFEQLKSTCIRLKLNYFKKVKLKRGEFGCLYSHFKAIKRFYDSNEEVAFICEDDLDTFFPLDSNKFKKKIYQIIEKIDKYGIISLSCVGNSKILKNIFCNIEDNYHKFEKNKFYGTGCYLINRKTAEKIIKLFIVEKNDKLLLYFKNSMSSYVADNFIYSVTNTHFYLPSLFYTKNIESLINSKVDRQNDSQNIMKHYINNYNSSYEDKLLIL